VFGHGLVPWLVAALCTEREASETVFEVVRATRDQCRAVATLRVTSRGHGLVSERGVHERLEVVDAVLTDGGEAAALVRA